MASSYRWVTLDASGTVVTLDQRVEHFPSQAEAEAWLGEEWPELKEAGVAEVTLMCGEERLYGPMSLSAE